MEYKAMSKYKNLVFVSAVALGSIALQAHAETGLYLGGSIGQAELSGGDLNGDSDKETAFSVFLGKQFNKHFALEGGYSDLGKYKLLDSAAARNEVEGYAIDVSALGLLPLNSSVSLFARGGIAYANIDRSYSYRNPLNGSYNEGKSDNDSEMEFFYGAGIQINPAAKFSVRVEYKQYLDVGGDNTGETDVKGFFVGGLMYF